MARMGNGEEGSGRRIRSGGFIGKKTMSLALILILFLVGAYFGGQYFFSSHFFFKTKINGVNVQLKSEKEALDLINEHLAEYKLKIHSEEGDMFLSAAEVGLAYKQTGDLNKLLKEQDTENWLIEIFKDHIFQAMRTSLDDKKLNTAILTLDCMHPKKPEKSKRAKIIYDEKQGCFVIQEATVGNEIDMKPFTEGAKNAILAGDDQLDLTTDQYYKQPKYTSASEKVLKAKALVDKYMGTVVHLKDGDRSIDINKEQIHNFIKVSDEYKVSFKKSEIEKFIRKSVWEKMNNDDNSRIIDSPGSGTIYVTSNYDDPKVVNLVEERKHLCEDIEAGKEVTREPEYNTDFLYSDYGDTIGDTYIDISIYDQEVYIVQGGELTFSSPCVTGCLNSGHSSPTGIYSIKMKTMGYSSTKYGAYFNYWMPYDMRYGIGLHDATWRSEGEFGGDTYINDGSHGCINLPYANAKEIYSIIEVGYPVIVH